MPLMYKINYIIKFTAFLLLVTFSARPVLALDMVSQPENVTVSATVTSISIIPTDEGGGGVLTGVVFSGYAYPHAIVHIWKNGTPKTTTVADNNGYFSINLNEIYSPSALYTLYAIDKDNRRSLLINHPVVIKSGYITQISGIRFAPTIITDKTEVKEGDYLDVSGYALPNTPINLTIKGLVSQSFHLTSKVDGTYQIPLPLIGFKKGSYDLFVNYEKDKRISKVIQFTIGNVNILSTEMTTNIPGDCNADELINIVDFSIAAFWYGKINPPKCIDTNHDNSINLVDFSILAFYWTG